MIVPFMLEPKATDVFGSSNLTLVFGVLNLLKKPKAFYLRLNDNFEDKVSFMICVSLFLNEGMDFLGCVSGFIVLQ